MVKFHKISQIEHGVYPFEDAIVDVDVLNGDFGDVADKKFVPNESGSKIIMQIENGDDEYMNEFKIHAGSHVRVLNPSKVDGELELYGHPLPDDFAVGDTVGIFTITEIIGNKIGAVVKVTGSNSDEEDPVTF